MVLWGSHFQGGEFLEKFGWSIWAAGFWGGKGSSANMIPYRLPFKAAMFPEEMVPEVGNPIPAEQVARRSCNGPAG